MTWLDEIVASDAYRRGVARAEAALAEGEESAESVKRSQKMWADGQRTQRLDWDRAE